MDAKLTKALSALADRLDYGHLLLATNATEFVNAVIAHLEAAQAELGELKVQISALQINATPKLPGEAALEILLARQELRAEAAEAECERLRDAAKALWDTFDVDDEGSGFVYWTTKPRHVERFERAFGIDQDAAGG